MTTDGTPESAIDSESPGRSPSIGRTPSTTHENEPKWDQILDRALKAPLLEQIDLAGQAVVAAEDAGLPAGVAESARVLAQALCRHAEGEAAVGAADQAVAAAEESGDRALIATTNALVMSVYLRTGRVDSAEHSSEAALGNIDALSLRDRADALTQLAIACSYRSDYPGAIARNMEAIEAHEKAGSLRGVARSHFNLSQVYGAISDLDAAYKHLYLSREISQQHGFSDGLMHSEINLGNFLSSDGRQEEARGHFEAGRKLALELEDFDILAWATLGSGRLERRVGNFAEGRALCEEALDLFARGQFSPGTVQCLKELAEIDVGEGRTEDGLARVREAIAVAEKVQVPDLIPGLHDFAVETLKADGNFEEALKHYQRSAEIKQELLSEERSRQIAETEARYQVAAARRDAELERLRNVELREAREKAEAANSAKSAFLATMSHEIRTPIHGILGLTDLLLLTDVTSEQQELVGLIRSSGQSLRRIIDDILDFSRVEAGKLEIEPVSFNLRQVLAESLAFLSPEARGRGLNLRSSVDVAVPDQLVGDPSRFRQVLTNLVGNAIKFTEEGEVLVRVEHIEHEAPPASSGTLLVSVEDTGIGIPPSQDIGVLFEPFVQADGSTARRHEGTGLGLAICRRLVGLFGGDIGAERRSPHGSRFWFTFPYEIGASRPSPRPSSTTATRSLRVLVAEDNAVNRFLIHRLLARLGHEPTAVSNGREVLARLAERNYDLVLMDVEMPGMDGFEATRQIREGGQTLDSGVPIVALTAHAISGFRQKCLDAGMDEFIAKPILAADLAERLQTFEPRR